MRIKKIIIPVAIFLLILQFTPGCMFIGFQDEYVYLNDERQQTGQFIPYLYISHNTKQIPLLLFRVDVDKLPHSFVMLQYDATYLDTDKDFESFVLELLRLMPRNASDTEGANRIVDLGYPVVEPVHRDMIQAMRVAESHVADIFADYFSKVGGAAAPAIAEGLHRENCWLRHRFFTRVFPSWSDHDLSGLRNILTMVATHPDAYHNDVRCVCLLAERGLADLNWLSQWLDFKRERMKEREKLVNKAASVIGKAQS